MISVCWHVSEGKCLGGGGGGGLVGEAQSNYSMSSFIIHLCLLVF